MESRLAFTSCTPQLSLLSTCYVGTNSIRNIAGWTLDLQLFIHVSRGQNLLSSSVAFTAHRHVFKEFRGLCLPTSITYRRLTHDDPLAPWLPSAHLARSFHALCWLFDRYSADRRASLLRTRHEIAAVAESLHPALWLSEEFCQDLPLPGLVHFRSCCRRSSYWGSWRPSF